MVRQVLGIGVVVLLVGALIGGGAYLILQDTNSGGGGGRGGQNQASTDGSGARGYRGNDGTGDLLNVERGGGNAAARGNSGNDRTGDLLNVERGGGNAAARGSSGAGTGTPEADLAPEEWLVVSGVVVALDSDLVVRTADGTELTLSLGPSWYRESSGVELAVGDEVQVSAFYEGEELMVGTIENLSSGQALALRNESGQPLWSGRGQRGQ